MPCGRYASLRRSPCSRRGCRPRPGDRKQHPPGRVETWVVRSTDCHLTCCGCRIGASGGLTPAHDNPCRPCHREDKRRRSRRRRSACALWLVCPEVVEDPELFVVIGE